MKDYLNSLKRNELYLEAKVLGYKDSYNNSTKAVLIDYIMDYMLDVPPNGSAVDTPKSVRISRIHNQNRS